MALAITTVALTEAQNGVPYNVQMQASGGTPPYSGWFLDEIVPDGFWLSITPEGQLVGTPGLIGPEEVTIGLYDSATPPNYAETTLYLTVLPPPAPAIPFGIIPAYLYQQYAGDKNFQALFAAYNAIAQYYLDWFISTPLAYYPGLSGDLLDWVAKGLYGQARTSLASPFTAVLGPLNTQPLNTAVLNGFIPSTNTSYTVSDDFFKRILTWNLYKGDGNRFCMRWIKRRIMRFIVGTNGLDPFPSDPGFVVGTEDTSAINVTVADHVLTVAINQAWFSSRVEVAPGILTFFQLAFLSGVLELPAQYTYAVEILTELVATASPTSITISGIPTDQTTPPVTFSVFGGSGSYSFSGDWSVGGDGIDINSPTANVSTFTAPSMTPGNTYTGTALWTITDTVTLDTTTASLSVSITCYSRPTATATPTSLSVSGSSPTEVTGNCVVTVTDGVPPYSHAWTLQDGTPGIVIGSPVSNTTNFSATGMPTATTLADTGIDTITDAVGQQTTATCAVSLNRKMELGLMNTQALNTATLNAYVPPS